MFMPGENPNDPDFEKLWRHFRRSVRRFKRDAARVGAELRDDANDLVNTAHDKIKAFGEDAYVEVQKAGIEMRDDLGRAGDTIKIAGKKTGAFALEAVNAAEAAAANQDHPWLAKSGKAHAPALLIGGAVLTVVGFKVGMAAGATRGVFGKATRFTVNNGLIAVGQGMMYRGFRAIYPGATGTPGDTPPPATPA